MKFKYKEAFIRNIGLLTEEEQKNIKKFTIAIPGMGGVGGAHLIACVREGFEKFKIADMDEFELKNFNRQYGASMSSIDKKKAQLMKQKALDINPNCKIEIYDKGISSENIENFLSKVDLTLDGLDFFEVEMRRELFNKCVEKNIPLITAGPIGFGCAGLIFNNNKYNFDTYFGVTKYTPYEEKLLCFALGLAPSMLHRSYMKGASLKEKKGPSSIGAVDLCAGFAVVNSIKILLKKGKVYGVPYYHQIDVMENKYVLKKLHFAHRNPLQIIKKRVAMKMYGLR